MKSAYWNKLLDFFYEFKIEDLDDKAMHQLKRSLLDYLGCSIYAASHDCSSELLEVIKSIGPGPGKASVWGSSEKLSPGLAAFANASRTSNIELDDGSGIGASVHPGVYVWTAAMAAYEANPVEVRDVLRSVVFGYDVCMRMGLLATDQVRNLGIHGPGMIGGLAAVATGGLILRLSKEELDHAFAITGTLLPLCPFVSFIQGADAKDMYGGWGIHLAFFAITAASRGLTGPKGILDGPKSIQSILSGQEGQEIDPGQHFYISDVGFKQYSACYSVHPAMSVVADLKSKHDIEPEDIKQVSVSTYPYAYDLNAGVTEPLNPSSGRLSLTYTVAYALHEGDLPPAAFDVANLSSDKYLSLGKKIAVSKNEAYGSGPFGVRGCQIEVVMNDGTTYEGEVQSARWKTPPSDEELTNKFLSLTEGALTPSQQQSLIDFAFSVERQASFAGLLEVLRALPKVKI